MGKPKPFRLTFDFTPEALGNRKRPKEDQFTVTVKDMFIRERLILADRIAEEAPDAQQFPVDHVPTPEERNAARISNRKQQDWLIAFARDKVVRVNGLTVVDAEENEKEVKSAKDLEDYCSDVLIEIANRLIAGATEEELKNSQSPSSAGSSATPASEPATSTVAATAS